MSSTASTVYSHYGKYMDCFEMVECGAASIDTGYEAASGQYRVNRHDRWAKHLYE